MGQKVSQLKWWSLLPLFIVFAFYYPRMLTAILGPANPWTSYLYLYGFGFLYTGSGVVLAVKTGACKLSRPRDRFWFQMIIAGFLYFAGLHAIWIYLAQSIPYLGGQ